MSKPKILTVVDERFETLCTNVESLTTNKQNKSTLETDVKNIVNLNYIKSLVDVYDGSVS